MKRSMVDAMVHAADPITEEDVSAWLGSPAAREARGWAGTPAEGPSFAWAARRRRRLPAVALAAALVLTLGAAAGPAAFLLGDPAPPKVKEDLRGVHLRGELRACNSLPLDRRMLAFRDPDFLLVHLGSER